MSPFKSPFKSPVKDAPTESSDGDDTPVFTVSALVRLARAQMEAQFFDVWVEGEIADLARPRSGHLYFSLHDERADAALRAVMWSSSARRLRFAPENGTLVRAYGTLTIYEARGTFQMRVDRLEPVGEGDLRRRFEQLKAKLEARGFLSPERKRELPWAPKCLGIVTSRSGAALRDILKVLDERLPVPVLLAHASVQGESAPKEIVQALARLAEQPDVEAVIVGRGGGSGDDLWAWNDESVALAIAAHPVPVVSAVGHQTDITIADLVADCRAATPTEAAMIAVPEREVLEESLRGWRLRLERSIRAQMHSLNASLERSKDRLPDRWALLEGPIQQLDELSRRLEEQSRGDLEGRRQLLHRLEVQLARLHPGEQVEHHRVEVAELDGRLRRWASLRMAREQARLSEGVAALDALSPLNVLARGYARVEDERGRSVSSASMVEEGDAVEVQLRRGRLRCEVKEKVKAPMKELSDL